MPELDKSKFNLGYLLKGDGLKDYYKSWGLGLRLGVTLLLLFAIGFTIKSFLPKKPQASSSTAIKTIEAGGTANITNINYKPEDNSHGLYVTLSTDRNTVGVYKTFAGRFEVQLGAGKDYDDNAVAEVTGKVKF